MSREDLVSNMIKEVGEYFTEYRYSHTLRMPMMDHKGDVVATANSLRSLGYRVSLVDRQPFGFEMIIIKP